MNSHADGQPPSRLDRIEAALEELTYKVDDFINTANGVLARSGILDEIVVGMNTRTTTLENIVVGMDARNAALENIVVRLDRNLEEGQRKFEENQRSTNAALERLEAILLRLMDK